MKFEDKFEVINSLCNGFILTVNRFKLIEELEKVNINFESELATRTKSLQNSYTKLQELERAKDEFIALTSHQLKTPLTVIKGYGDMLVNNYFGKLNEEQIEVMTKITFQTSQLLQISENILSVFKIKSSKYNYNLEDFNLVQLVEEIYETYLDKSKVKDLKFTLNKDINSLFINGDRYKIKQALCNLIDNAINYTEKGYVKISIEQNNIAIVDSGIGIPDYFFKNLYKKFERADNARNIKPDGTGIGLYLTKKILESSNMDIKINSSSNGTAVCITLPKATS
ncbi:MAG: HAMP domain-containing sensor histidine kinase [bacterium]